MVGYAMYDDRLRICLYRYQQFHLPREQLTLPYPNNAAQHRRLYCKQ